MPLRAIPTFDGAPIGRRTLPLKDGPAQWVTKADLVAACACAWSMSKFPPPAAAATALAALPDARLVGLSAPGAKEVASVTVGPAALSFRTLPFTAAGAGLPATATHGPGTKGARAPPGTHIHFLTADGAPSRLGIRVEQGGVKRPAAAAAAAAAPAPAPAPAPLIHRSPVHTKPIATIAAAKAAGPGPLTGLRIALLDADVIQMKSATVATGLGAAVAWLAPGEALTAWPASQVGVLGGAAAAPAARSPSALTPYTHIVAHDPASGPAKDALRELGLLPPQPVRPPPTQPQATQAAATSPPQAARAPQPYRPPAFSPPPGAPAVVSEDWLYACNKAKAALDAAPFARAWRESILMKEARAAGWFQDGGGGGGGGAGASPPSVKKARTTDGPVGGAAGPPPPAVATAALPPTPRGRGHAPPPGYLPPPLPLPVPCSPDTACAMIAAAAADYARYGQDQDADGTVATTATTRTRRHGRVVHWESTVPRLRPGGLQSATTKWTGGDSGVPWGAGDVWTEPFNPDGVARTLDKLYAHWMPTRKERGGMPSAGGGGGAAAGGSLPPPRPPPLPAAGSDTEEERGMGSSSSDDEDQDAATPAARAPSGAATAAAPPPLNGFCSHAACSFRPFCLVAKLREAGEAIYSKTGGGTGPNGVNIDFFKGRALRVGIDALEAWPHALNSRADVDAIHMTSPGGKAVKGVGPATHDKIWEVLSTGTLTRLEMAKADPVAVAVKALTGAVWGVGVATARRWVGLGIRTLEDLRAEVALPGGGRVGNLTATQRLGLEHAGDFAHRIPAVEVDAVVEAARAVAFGILGCDERGYPAGAGTATSSSPAHVRACGSWLRAHAAADIPAAAVGLAAARQATYGDVDMLISPPPADGAVAGLHSQHPTSPDAFMAATEAATLECHKLLRDVLAGLTERGFEIQAANTENWYAPSDGRVKRRVVRTTLADEGDGEEGAPLYHLTQQLGSGKDTGSGSGAAAAAEPQHPTPGAPASWMGAIRLPADHPALRNNGDGPRPRRWRRLDMKVYSRAALPTAVAYFTGDGSFNRALRFWAKQAPDAKKTAQEAAGPTSRATGWHLSDSHLFPISLEDDKLATRRPVGAGAALTCETDIFRALGLEYVPPFCRTFTNRRARE